MNCHSAQDQLLRAADGGLSAQQKNALTAHIESCAECGHFAESLDTIPSLLHRESESVPVPNAHDLWSEISSQLNSPEEQTNKPRKIAPIIWITAPIAAAATLLLAFLPLRQNDIVPVTTENNIVQVNYVEIEDPDSTAMVYVDKESGWLVVWADDPSVNRG